MSWRWACVVPHTLLRWHLGHLLGRGRPAVSQWESQLCSLPVPPACLTVFPSRGDRTAGWFTPPPGPLAEWCRRSPGVPVAARKTLPGALWLFTEKWDFSCVQKYENKRILGFQQSRWGWMRILEWVGDCCGERWEGSASLRPRKMRVSVRLEELPRKPDLNYDPDVCSSSPYTAEQVLATVSWQNCTFANYTLPC